MNTDINIVNGIVTGVQLGSPMQDVTPLKLEDNEKYVVERNSIKYSKSSEEILEKLPEPIGGASSWDDLKDKPFYANESQSIIYDGTLTFEDNEGLYIAPLTLSLDASKPYTVVFDGTVYKNVGRQVNTFTLLGNLSISGSGEDTGEPFLWFPEGTGMFVTNTPGEIHKVTIYTVSEDVYKLDRKFLPTLESIPDNLISYVTIGAIKNYYFKSSIDANTLKIAVDEMRKGIAQIYVGSTKLLFVEIDSDGQFVYVDSLLQKRKVPFVASSNTYNTTLGTIVAPTEQYMTSNNGTRYCLRISDAGELEIQPS